jgi:putative restriction endonuclease
MTIETNSEKFGFPWSRDELILALYLYCQIPFAKTKASNEDVQQLAHLIGRTPASVARKLGNFGAFDPLLSQQGISGLTHYSKADKEIWDEFSGRWNALVEESRRLLTSGIRVEKHTLAITSSFNSDRVIIRPLEGTTERSRMVKNRLFQSFFRRAVLSSYGSICCICGLDLSPLLVASHIIPWAARQDTRTDPQNGLCLCALHDKAFDRGLLSVDTNFSVIVSPIVEVSHTPMVHTTFLSFQNQQIRLPIRFVPRQEYLQWHIDNIFRNG